ncbi:hypothetical protein [Amycolatopsis anabasis]|uniref:hypothetical protein n=1 Tax=Amycolatopsis anabasis TaxID=1840409 RepID=UPI00131C1D50|nr:hypothetical protein [Amycolatopsis anabasis]
MAFRKQNKLDQVVAEAERAAGEGRAVFTARLEASLAVDGWSAAVEAIEAHGWVLDQWAVARDGGGSPEAYPLFRRAK